MTAPIIDAVDRMARGLGLPATIERRDDGELALICGERIIALPAEGGDELDPTFVAACAPYLVTDEVVVAQWRVRTGSTPSAAHRAILHELLRRGAGLGLKLGRFADAPARIEAGATATPLLEEVAAIPGVVRLRVTVGRELHTMLSEPRTGDRGMSWAWSLAQFADLMFEERGLVLPPVALELDESMAAPWIAVTWNDLVLPPRRALATDRVLVNADPARLQHLELEGIAVRSPFGGPTFAAVDARFTTTCRNAGLTTWDPREVAILELIAAARSAAAAFVNRNLIELLLLRLEQLSPEVVALARISLGLDTVVGILRSLAAEQISLRNLDAVLNVAVSLAAVVGVGSTKQVVLARHPALVFLDSAGRAITDLTPDDRADHVRIELRRLISRKVRGLPSNAVLVVDDRTEERLARAAPLTTAERAAFVAAVSRAVRASTVDETVIVTSAAIRRRLKAELAPEFHRVAVVAYQELLPDVNVQLSARISLTPPL